MSTMPGVFPGAGSMSLFKNDDATGLALYAFWRQLQSDLTFRTGQRASKRSQDYLNAYADLDDLLSPGTYSANEEPVPGWVVELGRMVVQKTEGILDAPEVVGLEDGALSLLWKLDDGFAALDVRGARFGACVRRGGETLLLFNGSASELSDFIERGLLECVQGWNSRRASTSTRLSNVAVMAWV